MAGLGLTPDPKILVIQGIVFIGALASSNYFFVKPALRLFNERRKRTSSAVSGARDLDLRAAAMEKAYQDELKAKMESAKELRSSEIIAGQAEVQSILSLALEESQKLTDKMTLELDAAILSEKLKLPELAGEVSRAVMQKLGLTALFLIAINLFATSLQSSAAFASGGGTVDTMYGIVWPYFQFLCFFVALVYFGRKTMTAVLESRRDSLRTKLSEAKQAVTLAERRAKELDEKLRNLKSEVESMQKSFVEEGVNERNRLVSEAKTAANNMLRDAQRTANDLVVKARVQLRKDLVEHAFDAVEKHLSLEGARNVDVQLKSEALNGFSSLSR